MTVFSFALTMAVAGLVGTLSVAMAKSQFLHPFQSLELGKQRMQSNATLSNAPMNVAYASNVAWNMRDEKQHFKQVDQ